MLAVKLRNADLLVDVGLDLEIGWLPPLVKLCLYLRQVKGCLSTSLLQHHYPMQLPSIMPQIIIKCRYFLHRHSDILLGQKRLRKDQRVKFSELMSTVLQPLKKHTLTFSGTGFMVLKCFLPLWALVV